MSNNNYWLGWLPLNQLKQGRESFSIPAFSLSGMTWLGASYIAGQFTFSGTRNFTLSDITAPANATFCAVVNSGGTRYKLWSGVGEILDRPLYAGELLLPSAKLELWTVSGYTTVVSTGFSLGTTKLLARTSEESTDAAGALVAATSIWSALPLVLPSTFTSAKA